MKKFAKLAAVFAALLLALSCFVACSNGSDSNDGGNQGGGAGNGGNGGSTEGSSLKEVAGKSIAGYTTAETKTQAGNNVSDMLYLLEGGKFELYKNLSYGEYSGFALFAKGSYSGNILTDGKLTFKIEEEVNTASLSENEKTMLGLSSGSAKSARSALVSRSEIDDIVSELKSLIKKLESIERKNVASEGKSLKLKSDRGGITVTDTDNQEQKITAGVSGVKIDLDRFLFTGNPCLLEKNEVWDWAGTVDDGAIPLKKTSDGKYTCSFIADDKDTLFKLMTEGWNSQYGLFSIDVENSSLPRGVRITNDTEVVNNTEEQEKYQDPENIAIAGIEKRRKYDITFDTAKTPGKICIELKKHVMTTLDGYMLSGSMTTPPGEELWPGDEKGGARPLTKNGDKWTCSLTMNKGWNGFMLIKEGWTYELGRSQLSSDNKSFSWDREDDVIAFNDYIFDGTEKATLTFTVRSDGLIDIDCDIVYVNELDLNGLYFVQDGYGKPTLIEDNAQAFTLSGSEDLTQFHLLDKVDNPPVGGTFEDENYYYYDGGCCWFDGTDYYYFRLLSRYDGANDKLPAGVTIGNYGYVMTVSNLQIDKDYTLKFDTKSKKGFFSITIE